MSLDTIVSDILWNFDTISEISNHQTLAVSGDKLNFDDRYLQSVRRTFSGDSRAEVLNAIKKTFTKTEEIIHSYQCNYYLNPHSSHIHQEQIEIINKILLHIKDIMDRRDQVITGLKTLGTFERYLHDSGFQIEMKRFIQRMQQLHEKCFVLNQHIDSRLKSLNVSNRTTNCCFNYETKTNQCNDN